MRVLWRIMASLLSLGICLWPFWAYLTIRGILNPTGFWQNLVMLLGGVYFLGAFQLIFAIVWIAIQFPTWATLQRD